MRSIPFSLVVLSLGSFACGGAVQAQVNLLHPPHHVHLTPKSTDQAANTTTAPAAAPATASAATPAQAPATSAAATPSAPAAPPQSAIAAAPATPQP